MKSMKIKKTVGQCIAPDRDYPYGLEIRLEKEQIDSLGIGIPEVGKKMTLHAMVKVSSISVNEGVEENNACVSLQITDMELSENSSRTMEEVFYGSKN